MSEAESSDLGKELIYVLSVAKKHSLGREKKRTHDQIIFKITVLKLKR